MKSVFKLLAQWLVVASLMATGLAMAQAEPTMGQIYATAQAGKLADAQVMVQQVLVSHPQSAKAYYVQAELYARQGQLDHARTSLDKAEKFAPGLPFAKPEAVQALRAQLAAPVARPMTTAPAGYAAAPAPSSGSWGLPLLLTGVVIVGAYFVFRRRNPVQYAQEPAYANPLNGPQTFGTGGGAMQPAYPPNYAPAGYPQGYPQQAAPGMGSRIMGGVATGLAVGAGVMAAEAIGRNLMSGHHNAAPPDAFNNNGFEPLPTNTDMGGNNFGISDTAWDDAGSSDAGGGSDWDN